jgi:hypothetical protein
MRQRQPHQGQREFRIPLFALEKDTFLGQLLVSSYLCHKMRQCLMLCGNAACNALLGFRVVASCYGNAARTAILGFRVVMWFCVDVVMLLAMQSGFRVVGFVVMW